MRAMEALRDDLESLMRTHREAAASVRVGWSGSTRKRFDRKFAELMSDFSRMRRLLDADAEELEQAMVTAEQRQRESQDAIARWERTVMNYNDAVAQARARANSPY